MGYLHIDNLYRNPDFLQCFALEKIHGTSAHVYFKDGEVGFFSGGETHDNFVALFDRDALHAAFTNNSHNDAKEVFVYGEAFGGKQQGMSATYGKDLRFLAFDVKANGRWLSVPSAEACCKALGIGFVPYERGPMTLEWLDGQRDRDSSVAVEPGKIREGVVIRPIRESIDARGSRVIYKHKRAEFRETKTVREVDPEKAAVLQAADAIAEEYVTRMRLDHVLQKTPFNADADTGAVIRAMQEDVQREAEGEIEWSRDVGKAVGKATVKLLHAMQVV